MTTMTPALADTIFAIAAPLISIGLTILVLRKVRR